VKKVLIILAVVCVGLAIAIVCTSIKPSYDITYSIDNELVSIVTKQDDEIVNFKDGKLKLKKGKSLRFEIKANSKGVDMSDFTMSINGKETNIVKNQSYNLFTSNNLDYGYYIIPKVEKDYDVEFSGAAVLENKFVFETDLTDQTAVEKMALAQISFTGAEEDYKDFYEAFSTEGEKSVTYNYKEETMPLSFKLKFEGGAPFYISDSLENIEFVTLKDAEEQEIGFESIEYQESEYLFTIGSVGTDGEYKIMFDFSKLEYKQFQIALPTENLIYTVTSEKTTTTYNETAEIVVEKLNNPNVDYTEMKLFAGEIELTKVSEEGNFVTFEIPENYTPEMTGNFDYYLINVQGLEYTKSLHGLSSLANFPDEEGAYINYKLRNVDTNGNILGVTTTDPFGNFMTFEGDRVALIWNYIYNTSNEGYQMPYDLYNYDIYYNEEKVLNLKEVIGDLSNSFVKEVGDYTIRAIFNEETLVFDSFQLEFSCSGAGDFSFTNFALCEKDVYVGFNFEDARVKKVEYQIYDVEMGNDWTALIAGEKKKVSVKYGQVIVYRVTSTAGQIWLSEMGIQENGAFTRLTGQTQSDATNYYTLFKFEISDLQYTNTKDMILQKGF